jgi:hypothetical protein
LNCPALQNDRSIRRPGRAGPGLSGPLDRDDHGRLEANYTVEQCQKDWLQTLNTQAESTVTGYRTMVRHLTELVGNVKLVELKVRDVDFALGKLAKRLSTRSVRLTRMILIQAIRNAMVNDLVVWNVADLATVPTSKPGRPSRSLNLEQGLCRAGRSQRRAPVAMQAPAPADYAYRCHRAWPAVRKQRKDRRRAKADR